MPNNLVNLSSQLKNLVKDLIKPTVMKAICIACISLKTLTEDNDAFGHFCAGTVCVLCGMLGFQAAFDHYEKCRTAAKGIAKPLNKAATLGEEVIKNGKK